VNTASGIRTFLPGHIPPDISPPGQFPFLFTWCRISPFHRSAPSAYLQYKAVDWLWSRVQVSSSFQIFALTARRMTYRWGGRGMSGEYVRWECPTIRHAVAFGGFILKATAPAFRAHRVSCHYRYGASLL